MWFAYLFDGDSQLPSVYLVIVERELKVRCSDLTTALYITFSLHYIFNIAYHLRLKDVFLFFQEVTDDAECKKSPTLSNFCTAIRAAEKKV